eukprot:7068498-Pyramimonas_sp.AAC.1
MPRLLGARGGHRSPDFEAGLLVPHPRFTPLHLPYRPCMLLVIVLLTDMRIVSWNPLSVSDKDRE